MEPISSYSSARASASQPPLPAQQRRDADALNAPQPRTDSFTASAPGQDVQLQRRQVVEDIGRNQKATQQLQAGSEQLQQARQLAQQASNPELGDDERQQLNETFGTVRKNLDSLARQVEKTGHSPGSEQRLRVSSGIANADEARDTAQAIAPALQQLNQDIEGLTQRGQVLGADFPRTSQRGNTESPVQTSQDATRMAHQLRQQLQDAPQSAVQSQANVQRQTALTLFQ